MKNTHIAFLLSSLLIPTNLVGQNLVIADSYTKLPIKSAKVMLWKNGEGKADQYSSDAAGNVALSKGNFTKIEIKHFGYERFSRTGDLESLGDTIFLKPNYILQEITVSAVRNHFKIKPDRYVYDVESDSTLADRTTLDAIGRVPILKVSLEGSISSMQGKAISYKLNGLSSPLLTGDLNLALRSLKARDVKQIEIVENPNGNDPNLLEVNIITKGKIEGYQATSYTRLTDYSVRSSLWGLTKIRNFCISGSYYYMYNKDHDSSKDVSEWRDNSTNNYLTQSHSEDYGYEVQMHNAEVSMSYDIDDNTILSAFGRVLSKVNPHFGSLNHTSIFSKDNTLSAAYTQTSNTKNKDAEYEASMNFEKLYGNGKKGKLYIGYEWYYRPLKNNINVNFTVDEDNAPTLLPNYSSYLRQKYFDSSYHTLMTEYWRKFSNRHTVYTTAIYRFRNESNGDLMPESDWKETQLKQNLAEASAAYQYATDKLSMRGSMAAKFYHDYIEDTNFGPDYSFSHDSWVWQPTLSASYVPNSRSSYGLAFTRSANVPDITVMNPYRFQDVPTEVTYGNSDISTEKTSTLSLSSNFNFPRLYMGISVSGQYTSDIILRYSFLDDKDVLNYTYGNIGNRKKVSLSPFATWNPSRKTSLRFNVTADYIQYRSSKLDLKNSGFQCNTNVNVNQECPWGIWMEAWGSYNTPWINFQGKGGTNFDYGFSLGKNLLSENLRLTLSASSFVPIRYKRTYDVESDGLFQRTVNRNFHANFSFSITYSFGRLRARVKTTESSISNDDIKQSYDE